jgi:drug/metabolite transporter (DMT)-like permease
MRLQGRRRRVGEWTVNPIAAVVLAALLIGEPITPNLVIGLVAVFAGIGIATSTGGEIKKP